MSRITRVSALVCGLILVLIAGAGLTWHLLSRPVRLDFKDVGGTILTYEVDRRDHGDEPVDMAALVQALQRRQDNLNYGVVTVREGVKDRVELLVARRANHAKDVQDAKDLTSQVGRLEFRIVANSRDDMQGQQAAIAAINAARDQLAARAKAGLPPMGPTQLDDPTRTELAHFTLRLSKRQKSVVTYSWVELGPQERRSLNLDHAARTDPERAHHFKSVKYDDPFYLDDAAGRPTLGGALFFARKCEDLNLPDEMRRAKDDEFFVLARDTEFDPADPLEKTRVPSIDGSYLTSAMSTTGADSPPAVRFTFNAQGGSLFGELTRKNLPEGNGTTEITTYCHLAIILDGLVLSAPTIHTEIREQGQISGSFTEQEVNNFVRILMPPSLPVRLKLQPISEAVVSPR
jgi:preprotein translocase subunit SecD